MGFFYLVCSYVVLCVVILSPTRSDGKSISPALASVLTVDVNSTVTRVTDNDVTGHAGKSIKKRSVHDCTGSKELHCLSLCPWKFEQYREEGVSFERAVLINGHDNLRCAWPANSLEYYCAPVSRSKWFPCEGLKTPGSGCNRYHEVTLFFDCVKIL